MSEVVSHHFFRRTARARAMRLNEEEMDRRRRIDSDSAEYHYSTQKARRGPYYWVVRRERV